MNRTLSLVLVAIVGLSGVGAVALPVQAAPTNCSGPTSSVLRDINDYADHYALLLRDRGIPASGVESFGSCIRAYVTGPDGQQSMQYFDPDTLQQIDVEG
jgi:hypothetical protein